MGIAKSIEAYGIFEDYTSDTTVFIQTLSEMLDSDFVVSIADVEGNLLVEEQLFDFNKPSKHRLYIAYHKYTIGAKLELLPCYFLDVPINYIYEQNLEIEFYPNKTCQIRFLTFEHIWETFIEILRWQRSPNTDVRVEVIREYNQLRNEYWKILKKIRIDQIFIITHAYYKFESITDMEDFPELNFERMIEAAKMLDNFSIFNLNEILKMKRPDQVSAEFMTEEILKIAFIDTP
jgi:hypothetical protein